ncbi:MAG: histidine phosphatase family protein [Clostridia bacterium]|nr:histidine phosphatase family protein [Clostridia bacterium]
MKLYVARHGETTWNVEWRVSGITDVELTERGREQARAAADILKNEGIEIVIVSPLKRAMHTAEIINEKCNALMKIDNRLTEQNYGVYEGVHRKSEGFLGNKRQFAFRYPGGESMMQVAYRVYSLLDELREKYSDKNVLLVTHGGVCRVIKTYFEDMTNEEFFNYSQDNCALAIYDV